MIRKNNAENDANREAVGQEDGLLLTAEKAGAATFLLAEPRGYYHVQVDAFVEMVERSIRAWENRALYLEQLLHEAQEEIDRLSYENQSLRAQIEVFRVNGSPVVDSQGNYLTETQAAAAGGGLLVADGARLSTEIDRLTGENTELLTQIVELQEQIKALGGEPQVYSQAEPQYYAENYENYAYETGQQVDVGQENVEAVSYSNYDDTYETEPTLTEPVASEQEIPEAPAASPKSGRLWGRKKAGQNAPVAVTDTTPAEPIKENSSVVFGAAENSWDTPGSD